MSFKFEYTSDEGFVIVYRNCFDIDEATRLREKFKSLGGSSIERDAEFLYCVFPEENGPEAARELKAAGFETDLSEVEFTDA